jgi:hypothetical protein
MGPLDRRLLAILGLKTIHMGLEEERSSNASSRSTTSLRKMT